MTVVSRLNVVLIFLNPERNTLDVLMEYLSSFDPRITGLAGDPRRVALAVEEFRTYAEKFPAGYGEYTMDHTAGIFLFRADGRFANIIDYHEDRAFALPEIRRL